MKRKAKTAAYIIVAAAILLFLFGWKVPVILKIESLHLPEGCETVYPVKVHISDVYWLHIKGEKVIKCSLGYEAAKEYIEAHNTLESWRIFASFPMGGCRILPFMMRSMTRRSGRDRIRTAILR